MSARFFGYLRPTAFSRDSLMLMMGSGVAQIFPILLSPLITRLYAPESFGAFSLILGIIIVCAALAAWGYEHAIMLPKSDEEAAQLLSLCTICAHLTTALSAIAAFVFADALAAHGFAWWLLPLGIYLAALFELALIWHNRRKRFGQMSASRMAAGIATPCTQILTANLGSVGLLAGHIAGRTIGLCFLRPHRMFARLTLQPHALRAVASRFSQFHRYNFPSIFINKLSGFLPLFLIFSFFGAAPAGFFMFANRLLGLSIIVIAENISQVFYQRISQIDERAVLKQTVKNLLKKLCAAAVCIAIAPFILPDDMFSWVFGAQWADAIHYVRALAPGIAAYFALNAIERTLYRLENMRLVFAASAANFVLMGAVVTGSAIAGFSPYQTILIYSAYAALYSATMIMLIFKRIDTCEL